MGTFRAKEKITAKPQQVVDWTLAKEPDADRQSKDLTPTDPFLSQVLKATSRHAKRVG